MRFAKIICVINVYWLSSNRPGGKKGNKEEPLRKLTFFEIVGHARTLIIDWTMPIFSSVQVRGCTRYVVDVHWFDRLYGHWVRMSVYDRNDRTRDILNELCSFLVLCSHWWCSSIKVWLFGEKRVLIQPISILGVTNSLVDSSIAGDPCAPPSIRNTTDRPCVFDWTRPFSHLTGCMFFCTVSLTYRIQVRTSSLSCKEWSNGIWSWAAPVFCATGSAILSG